MNSFVIVFRTLLIMWVIFFRDTCSPHPLESNTNLIYQDDLHLDSPQFKVVLLIKLLDVKLCDHVFNLLIFFFLFLQTTPIIGFSTITSKNTRKILKKKTLLLTVEGSTYRVQWKIQPIVYTYNIFYIYNKENNIKILRHWV